MVTVRCEQLSGVQIHKAYWALPLGNHAPDRPGVISGQLLKLFLFLVQPYLVTYPSLEPDQTRVVSGCRMIRPVPVLLKANCQVVSLTGVISASVKFQYVQEPCSIFHRCMLVNGHIVPASTIKAKVFIESEGADYFVKAVTSLALEKPEAVERPPVW